MIPRLFRHRYKIIFTLLACIMAVYVSSYYVLSRRGFEEARTYDLEGFLYIPIKEAERTHDLSRHYRLARIFYPLNLIDQTLFGSPPHIRGIMYLTRTPRSTIFSKPDSQLTLAARRSGKRGNPHQSP